MLDYPTYISQTSNLMVIGSTDASFQTMAPGMIDYAENRIYRDLDLLATRVTNTSASLSSGVRSVALSTTSGTILVVENVNVITPSTATATTGTRIPLTFTSRDFIDNVYPSGQAATGTPLFCAMVSNTTLLFGPSPDAAYPIEVVGTIRPTVLSSNNSSTILTQMLPDLFIAASMVFASGYMRDFGAQADNPQQAAAWEGQYTTLFKSANVEELRKRYMSEGWTNQTPSPVASPPRV